LVQELEDSSARPLTGRTDWARLDAMTEEEVMAAALSDPDNPPLTAETAAVRRRVPQARVIRRALHLTQEEFAGRFIADDHRGRIDRWCQPPAMVRSSRHRVPTQTTVLLK